MYGVIRADWLSNWLSKLGEVAGGHLGDEVRFAPKASSDITVAWISALLRQQVTECCQTPV